MHLHHWKLLILTFGILVTTFFITFFLCPISDCSFETLPVCQWSVDQVSEDSEVST